jgi:hypothetical protein
MQFRHGDILITAGQMPAQVTELKHSIIAEGETTGHAHRLHDGVLYEDAQGNMFVRVPEGKTGTLTHEEHGTIALPAGDYVVTRQREYNPYERSIRQVAD